jgi:hypothetical protein
VGKWLPSVFFFSCDKSTSTKTKYVLSNSNSIKKKSENNYDDITLGGWLVYLKRLCTSKPTCVNLLEFRDGN